MGRLRFIRLSTVTCQRKKGAAPGSVGWSNGGKPRGGFRRDRNLTLGPPSSIRRFILHTQSGITPTFAAFARSGAGLVGRPSSADWFPLTLIRRGAVAVGDAATIRSDEPLRAARGHVRPAATNGCKIIAIGGMIHTEERGTSLMPRDSTETVGGMCMLQRMIIAAIVVAASQVALPAAADNSVIHRAV